MAPTISAQARAPVDEEALVAWVAERYDRCHPDDSFGNLVRRAFFSKEDRRLMEDWLAAGRCACGRSDGAPPTAGSSSAS
jgi:hypothetical protein